MDFLKRNEDKFLDNELRNLAVSDMFEDIKEEYDDFECFGKSIYINDETKMAIFPNHMVYGRSSKKSLADKKEESYGLFSTKGIVEMCIRNFCNKNKDFVLIVPITNTQKRTCVLFVQAVETTDRNKGKYVFEAYSPTEIKNFTIINEIASFLDLSNPMVNYFTMQTDDDKHTDFYRAWSMAIGVFDGKFNLKTKRSLDQSLQGELKTRITNAKSQQFVGPEITEPLSSTSKSVSSGRANKRKNTNDTVSTEMPTKKSKVSFCYNFLF